MTVAVPNTYAYTGTIVTYVVPVTGIYDITAFGAQGGNAGTFAGGLGAEVGVDVTLTAGSVLDILVGGQGAAGSANGGPGGGGGGGSFVAEANGTATPTLLAAAGGGGGAFDGFIAGPGTNASIGSQGTSPGGGTAGNAGGSNGGGGGANFVLAGAGGGGGYTGNGQSDMNGSNAAGGLSFTAYLSGQTNSYAGGFGGGGQGAAVFGATGGGGGGYSGGGAGGNGYNGDAGAGGGGGGSFFALNAATVTLAGGVQTGNGLVEIVPVVACFAAGTRIATPDGEVAVERLAVGDAVRTHGGGVRSVIWIGRRTIDCSRHPRPELVRPVRIAADAFGPGLPARPLFLSPDHALFIDGVLIPVKYLVDGGRVTQHPVGRVTYYHVELSSHDVLLAEGLAAESYLDDGARGLFAEAGGTITLHPDFPVRAREASGCAPHVVTGPAIAAARARLAEADRRAA